MSKPTAPRSETPPLPTRSQLDELDALLQRMLELPVNHAVESGLPPLETSVAEEPALPEASDWSANWEQSRAEPDEREGTLATRTSEGRNVWHSRWSPPADTDRPIMEAPSAEFPPLPSEDRWVEPESPTPKSWESSSPSFANSPTEAPATEVRESSPSVFGPPTLQVILGWLGLICLLGSLALLAYDWFGWTW